MSQRIKSFEGCNWSLQDLFMQELGNCRPRAWGVQAGPGGSDIPNKTPHGRRAANFARFFPRPISNIVQLVCRNITLSTLLKRAFGMSDYVKTQTKISKPFGTWSPNPASLSSIVRVRGIDGCDLFFSISWTFVIVHAQVVLEAM
ncbi:hypothetical protein TWF225_004430 [Orbilia oligospora]|nr:hypothetical protein TWF225_004430 [Orbilia oligospora]